MQRKKVIVFAALAGALAIGAAVYFVALPALQGTAQGADAAGHEDGPQAPGSGPMYHLKERVLNLADRGARRYVKIGLALEFERPADWQDQGGSHGQSSFASEIEQRAPLLNDALTTIVTAKTTEQLASPQGKESLKEELRTQFNAILGEPRVLYVYFNEFLIQ